MARGFVYLTAVLDWHSRRVLAWRTSITLDARFCVEAFEEAVACHGAPEIVNTDQGCQFTCATFTAAVQAQGSRLSMDGRGAWRGNVFVERLWRSVKYDEVYLHAYDTVREAREGLRLYFAFYNQRRPHAALSDKTPDAAYFQALPLRQTAA